MREEGGIPVHRSSRAIAIHYPAVCHEVYAGLGMYDRLNLAPMAGIALLVSGLSGSLPITGRNP